MPYALRSLGSQPVLDNLSGESWLAKSAKKALKSKDFSKGAEQELKDFYNLPSTSSITPLITKLAVTGGVIGLLYKGVSYTGEKAFSHGVSHLELRTLNRLIFGEKLQADCPSPFKFVAQVATLSNEISVRDYFPAFLSKQSSLKEEAELYHALGYTGLTLIGATVLATALGIHHLCSKKRDQ